MVRSENTLKTYGYAHKLPLLTSLTSILKQQREDYRLIILCTLYHVSCIAGSRENKASNQSVPKRLKRDRSMATPHSQKRCNPNLVSQGIRSRSPTSGTAAKAYLIAVQKVQTTAFRVPQNIDYCSREKQKSVKIGQKQHH